GLPALALGHWLMISSAALELWQLGEVFARTALAAAPAAILATLLALPIALLTIRHPRAGPVWLFERLVYLGYAVPPLAFALAMVFLALTAIPWAYQTLGLLIVAYTLSFMALTMGPIRTALLQMGTRAED